MRFKIFGFKGELSTVPGTKRSKKKAKEDKDGEIVGVGFRSYSEFGPSTSKFQKSLQMNGSAKFQENDKKTEATKPTDWCGTKAPTQANAPPPKGYSGKDTDQKNDTKPTADVKVPKRAKPILKKAPEIPSPSPATQQETAADQNHEKSTLISMTENRVENAEASNKSDQPIYDDIKDVKVAADGKKYITLGGFDDQTNDKRDSEDEFGTKNTAKADGRTFITLGGFEDRQDSDSEDEFGGKKTPGTNGKSLGSNENQKRSNGNRQTQQNAKETNQSATNYGCSDQAASIFFRNDSPEPEQRVRNFSIKKSGYNSDEEDNTSQTSV